MAVERFEFDTKMNTSLQVGDKLWYSTATNGILGDLIEIGVVHSIHSNNQSSFSINVTVNSTGLVPANSFILFEKHIKANESSLKGYYADVTLENSSKKRAELFAVSSEIVPSSK